MIDTALRVAVLLAAAWLTTAAMRRAAAAATRHLVWTSAITGALAMPLLTAVTPRVTLPVPAALKSQLPTSNSQGTAPRGNEAPSTFEVDKWRWSKAPSALEFGNAARDGALWELVVGRWEFSSLARAVRPAAAVLAVWAVFAVWAALSVLLLARIAFGVAAVRRLGQHALPPDTRWRERLERACDELHLRRRVRIRISPDVTMPMTFGHRSPVVLLPEAARHWTEERARLVLLHELAHVARGDWATHLLARVVAAIHWFNPLAWIALRRMAAERERACDDRVLAHGAVPAEYASHLLDIARAPLSPRLGAALAMARPSELEGRLLAILGSCSRERRAPSTWAIAATGVAITAAVAAADGATPQVEPAAHAPVAARRAAGSWMFQDDDPPEERQRAADERAQLEPLAAKALDAADEGAREEATLSLALRSEPGVVDALLGALKDEASQVREKAAIGLALRRDPRVVEALLEAADDPDSQVREKVLIALSLTGDSRATAVLARKLKDPDAQVREKAASGLTLFSLATLGSRDGSR